MISRALTGSRLQRGLMAAIAIAAMGMVVSIPSPVIAEDCDEEEGQKKNDGKANFHIEERNGQKVYVIDKVITVCGKVPRPSVVYVLQARNINYEWESLKQDFLPKILNSVKKAPF